MRSPFSLLVILCLMPVYVLRAQDSSNYFQQRVDYQIQAELDDVNNRIHGMLKLRYENRSAYGIDTIWFHLWPNAYSGRHTPLCRQMLMDRDPSLYFAKEPDLGKISGYQFSAEGRILKTHSSGSNPEILGVVLEATLEPGSRIQLVTPFQVDIPNARFSRLGRDGYSFNLTQWYPKPAVLDRDGWHCMPYLNRGEFYSEFGDFDVEITIPENYVVAASGELVTESEKSFLKELDRKTRKSLIEIPSKPMDSIPSAVTKKTIRFVLEDAHDFAWFASKYYQVLLDTVTLASGKKVATSAFFGSQRTDLWKDCLDYSESGLKFLSDEIGDYPYESFAVVDGRISAGGGMEYPGITILNTPASASDLERVLVHELGHNWFYGALASNERDHPWMDEGMNTHYEFRYMSESRKSRDDDSPNGITKLLAKALGVGSLSTDSITDLALMISSFDNSDQPITTQSEDFSELNYGVVAYIKTAMAFEFLYEYLGAARAKQCIQEYYASWAFRHPSPVDLQASFEKSAGENLDWFFHDFLNSNSPHRVQLHNQTAVQPGIRIERKSGPVLPLYLEFADGSNQWIRPFAGDTLLAARTFNGDFSINRPFRNIIKSKNLPFRDNGQERWTAPKFRMLPSLYNAFGRDNMFVLPVIGWNAYDRLMAGVTWSNKDFIPAPFEFSFTPLFSSEFNHMSGSASVEYNWWPVQGTFREIEFGMSGKRYGYDVYENVTETAFALTKPLWYGKWSTHVGLEFNKPDAWASTNSRLEFQLTGVWAQTPVFTIIDNSVIREFKTMDRYHGTIKYDYNDSRIIDPYGFSLRVENGDRYVKCSAELNYRFTYKEPRKGLDIRIFAGGFLQNQSLENVNFRMSSWSGSNDYLFEELYLGRNETTGIWSRQMMIRDGGFVSPTPFGQTDQWIGSIHLSTDNPTPVPLRFFFNAGVFEGIRDVFIDINEPVMFEGGVTLSLIKGIAEIHSPLFFSKGIERTFETNNVKFAERIRFVLDLSQLSFDSLRKRAINSIR